MDGKKVQAIMSGCNIETEECELYCHACILIDNNEKCERLNKFIKMGRNKTVSHN